MPAAFFRVCPIGATDTEGAHAVTDGYLADFSEETGWEPEAVATFAGALPFSEYGFFERLLMERIAREAVEGVDTP